MSLAMLLLMSDFAFCCYDLAIPFSCFAHLAQFSGCVMTNPTLAVIKSDLAEKWQQMLSDLITDPKELLQILELDPKENPFSQPAQQQFPLKAPRSYVQRIEKGNWLDPLLRQIWPCEQEEVTEPGFSTDPLSESQFNPVPGLLHKYHGRVLLTAAPHCAIHCRYCFRRHFDYHQNSPNRAQWDAAFDYIRKDNSIEEVILSGGDPLAISDRQLSWIIDQLEQIPHLSSLRIHSRLAVVIPQRMTASLLNTLRCSRLKTVLVVHCNHSRELSPELADSFSTLAANGTIILNQSVLLKDVNDNLHDLIELSKSLFQHHVLPYYLHLPDRVAGTGHFGVDEAHGKKLVSSMQAQLPGYLVPRLVREVPGQKGKTPIA